jgi:hypothetical protein
VKENRWSALIEFLDGANVPFDEGLTDAEVLQAETKYDIHFPFDLREFLQTYFQEAIRYIQTGVLERRSGLGACCTTNCTVRYSKPAA